MTLVQYTFDSQTSGTVATTANTGAATVDALNGGAVTFDSSMAARGTACGLKFTGTGTTSAADVRYTIPSNSVYEWSFVFTMPAATGTDYILHQLYAGSTRGYSLTYTAAGNLSIYDSANTVTSIITGAAPGAKYRITLAVDNSGGTAAGKFTAKAYSETGTTPLATPATSSTANLASGAFTQLRIGQTTFPAAGGTFGVDDVQWNDGSTTEIPGMTSSNPPTVVSNDRALYVIDRHGTTSNDGGTLTYSIAQTSGTTTTATLLGTGIWGVVQSTAGALGYTVTITDSIYGNTTSTATVPQQTTTNANAPLHWNPATSAWV